MNKDQVRTLEQVREVVAGTQALRFKAAQKDAGRYAWIGTETPSISHNSDGLNARRWIRTDWHLPVMTTPSMYWHSAGIMKQAKLLTQFRGSTEHPSYNGGR